LIARAPDANAKVIADWVGVDAVDRIFLARESGRCASNTSVCLKVVDPSVAKLPAEAQAAFVKGHRRPRWRRRASPTTLNAYRDAPPGLRIWWRLEPWSAPMSRRSRLWLDWAFAETKDAPAEGGVMFQTTHDPSGVAQSEARFREQRQQ